MKKKPQSLLQQTKKIKWKMPQNNLKKKAILSSNEFPTINNFRSYYYPIQLPTHSQRDNDGCEPKKWIVNNKKKKESIQ
jgi:hypothetical protein